jgi:hypothetical protein
MSIYFFKNTVFFSFFLVFGTQIHGAQASSQPASGNSGTMAASAPAPAQPQTLTPEQIQTVQNTTSLLGNILTDAQGQIITQRPIVQYGSPLGSSGNTLQNRRLNQLAPEYIQQAVSPENQLPVAQLPTYAFDPYHVDYPGLPPVLDLQALSLPFTRPQSNDNWKTARDFTLDCGRQLVICRKSNPGNPDEPILWTLLDTSYKGWKGALEVGVTAVSEGGMMAMNASMFGGPKAAVAGALIGATTSLISSFSEKKFCEPASIYKGQMNYGYPIENAMAVCGSIDPNSYTIRDDLIGNIKEVNAFLKSTPVKSPLKVIQNGDPAQSENYWVPKEIAWVISNRNILANAISQEERMKQEVQLNAAFQSTPGSAGQGSNGSSSGASNGMTGGGTNLGNLGTASRKPASTTTSKNTSPIAEMKMPELTF